MRADAGHRFLDHAQRLGGGDQRPVGARDLERQIAAGRGDLVGRRGRLDARGALERVEAAAGVDRPLQVEPRAVVVGNIGIDDPKLVVRPQDAERLDVIRARVAGLRRDLRQRRGVPLADDGLGGLAAGDRFRDPMAGLEAAPDGLVDASARSGARVWAWRG